MLVQMSHLPKNFCKDLIIRCIRDRYSLDTRIHLIKSLDISVLKAAFPDITRLLEPAKYLGKKWVKFLPGNKYEAKLTFKSPDYPNKFINMCL